VPEGGAVEFVLDYAANRCFVSFYAPEAVVGDRLVALAYARLELRFDPRLAEGVRLYPAVQVREGVEVRLL
jgi:hypothetical protein